MKRYKPLGMPAYGVREDFVRRQIPQVPGLTVNAATVITRTEAQALGVTSQALDEFFAPEFGDDPVTSVKLYKNYLQDSSVSPWTPEYRKQGTLSLFVDVPTAGGWKVTVINALNHEKTQEFDWQPGLQAHRYFNVDAGNCFVRVESNDKAYYRQDWVMVRAGQTAGVGVRFAIYGDPSRFKIKSLVVTQATQNQEGDVPLVEGRKAMIRFQLQDLIGLNYNPDRPQDSPFWRLKLETFSSPMGWATVYNDLLAVPADAVKSGISLAGVQPTIDADKIRSGLKVRATLSSPDGATQLDQVTITPEIRAPLTVVLHTYDVRPRPGAGGVPVARNPGDFWAELGQYMQDIYPGINVVIQAEGKIWIADPSFGYNGVFVLGTTLATMNVLANSRGYWQGSQRHLFVGMVNRHWISDDTVGMAWYGYPALALFMKNDYPSEAGYALAHEMGHCFGLEHAPSVGADTYTATIHFNRIDANYPFSGNGLAAGVGYSVGDGQTWGNFFLREDARHWDPQAYTGGKNLGRGYQTTHFSDFFYKRILAQTTTTAARPPVVTFGVDSDGFPILGATQANTITTWNRNNQRYGDVCLLATPSVNADGTGTAPLNRDMTVRSPAATLSASLANQMLTSPNQGLMIDPGGDGGGGGGGGGTTRPYPDPRLGDPDDPTPPVLIVTKAPTLGN